MAWKTIKDNPRYEVSDSGEIRNVQSGKLVKLHLDRFGYQKVWLSYGKRNSAKPSLVHRLVAIEFISNPNGFPEVNHKNHIRTDNRVENLEWCTTEQNVQDARGHKISVSKNGVFVGSFPSIASAGRAIGLSDTMVGYCLKGKSRSTLGFTFSYTKG